MVKLSYNKLYFFIIIVFYFSFLFFYDFTQSRDFNNYADWYSLSVENEIGSSFTIKDPMFYIVSRVSNFFSFGVIGLVVFYVLVSAWAKMKLLSVLNFSVSMLTLFFVFYFCKFFILLEGTQFRAAVAIPLATLGVIYYLHGHKKKALLAFACSSLFHLSVIIICFCFLVSIILSKYKRKSVFLSFYMVFLCAILFKFDVSVLLGLPLFGERVSDYVNGNYEVTTLSLLNSYLIFKVILLMVIFSSYSLANDQRVFIFGSLSFFGMLLFAFFRDVDSLAIRLHELFSLFDALLFSYAVGAFKKESKILYILASFPVLVVFINSSLAILH
ncbi:EpsG family protein [Aeromonas taiwanensis]|uniref:EpsG family protein n=1 Tax=Aeromonas taiwanensis TaxID=633417 RepID=UPI00248D57BC|nr:EpsG family protein [Aeromonas taiwanensis]